MKKLIFIVYLISMCFIGRAQKISDSYFKEREKYWTIDYKKYVENNKYNQDTLHYDLVNNGGKREKGIINYLFKEYQKLTRKDLDTSNYIFILTKKAQMRSDIVIWNSTDTIYTQTDLFIPHIKDPQLIKLYPFKNVQINKERGYITAVMNMVSEIKPEEIQDIIDKKTLDENGKFRLILDGSRFELYFFLKQNVTYDVKRFLFNNPRLN